MNFTSNTKTYLKFCFEKIIFTLQVNFKILTLNYANDLKKTSFIKNSCCDNLFTNKLKNSLFSLN